MDQIYEALLKSGVITQDQYFAIRDYLYAERQKHLQRILASNLRAKEEYGKLPGWRQWIIEHLSGGSAAWIASHRDFMPLP